jgi:hypothetical protein
LLHFGFASAGIARSQSFANRLTAFEARYNTAARPFDWRLTP